MLATVQRSRYKRARVPDTLFTITFGGLLLMMGHHSRAESLFYYFRLEDQVPENHLLRLIDRHVSFDFVRAKLKASYSDTGRPSIDPDLLLRMLLVGYLYGVTSERKLVEELRMHLAWRWFTGLGFDQEIPHHSTFSKNRHGRFQESNLFQELFEEIVARCVEAGLVRGEHMSVDGSFIQANADHHSRVPREQLAEVAKVNHTVREYLAELERENPVEPPVAQQEKVSTTDPDSTYATKGGPARLGYYDNYLVDNASCVIVGVQATPARLSQESAAARDMIERYRARYGYLPQTLAADTTYGNGELLQWLDERGIAAYIRVKQNPAATTDLYGIDKFTYVPEENCYICPEGKLLKYVGVNPLNRTHLYYSTVKRCRDCSQKSRCTRGKYRTLAIHICEPARQRAHALAQTPAFAISQRARRKVEALFAELKNYIGLRRLRLRRMRFVREQFYLAATVQNLKRLVRFLTRRPELQTVTA
jgi:transposase